jgi:hypothetical protein
VNRTAFKTDPKSISNFSKFSKHINESLNPFKTFTNKSLYFLAPRRICLRISNNSCPNLRLKRRLLQLPKLRKTQQHLQITCKRHRVLRECVARLRCPQSETSQFQLARGRRTRGKDHAITHPLYLDLNPMLLENLPEEEWSQLVKYVHNLFQMAT